MIKIATTKIWAIKNRLDHVINYANDKEKISEDAFYNLHKVINYTKSEYKTEKQLYVSTINCSKENAYIDMINTKKRFNKLGGILGFHAYQSFVKDEVTPQIAHEIGVEFAKELWGDRFEVIVTTHLNTEHLHNHICVNSVSFKDGKKYYDNHYNYAILRETSDAICEEYKLNVLKDYKIKKINYANFYKAGINKSNYYKNIKEDIDFSIKEANSYQEFIDIMKKLEYEVTERYGKINVKKYNKKRNVRIERIFGEEYSKSALISKISKTKDIQSDNFNFIKRTNKKYTTKINIRNKKKITKFQALYLYYCYLLKIFPRKKQYISKTMKEESKRLDQVLKEVRFIAEKNIKNEEELLQYKLKNIYQKGNLKSTRENLYKKLNKGKKEVKQQIETITKEIYEIDINIKNCENIAKRTRLIKEELQEIKNKNKIKEVIYGRKRDECIK